MNVIISFIFFVSIQTLATSTNLPSFIKVCHRSDPHLNECVKDSVELLRPLLAHGIPQIGIPSCEPLRINQIVVDQNGSAAMTVQSAFSNIEVYGPSQFVLKKIKLNLQNDTAEIELWFPHLKLRSNYSLYGRILMLPISGKGKCYGNYSDVHAKALVLGQKINRNYTVYFNVNDFLVDFDIGSANIHLDNLFNGDKELGDAMNIMLNQNWKSLAKSIKPSLEKAVGDVFKNLANEIYKRYPMDVLLPP